MHDSKMRPYIFAVAGIALLLAFQNCSDVGFEQIGLSGLEEPFDRDDLTLKKTHLDLAASSSQVDILFVVDNSGSMAVYQKNMSERIDGFMAHVKSLDYRIAVTSTDPNSSRPLGEGKFHNFGGSVYLDPSGGVVQNQHQLGQAIQMGDTGSGDEQGIKALLEAIAKRDQRPAFFREDSALAVVLISDEDECSNGQCGDSSNRPHLALSAVKDSFGSDKVFVFNSILHQGPRGSNPKCPQAHSEARHGAEYAQLTSMTGGIEGSVCENSYAQQLSDIGQRTESLVRTVTLECAPQDINRDGVGDVAIFKNNQRIHPTFQLAGDKITFDVELGPGEYWFHYYCKK